MIETCRVMSHEMNMNPESKKDNAMLVKRGPVIAIDGPAGTGKSSVTRRLAEELGYLHVDTGALYRAIALLTLEKMRHPGSAPSGLPNRPQGAIVFGEEDQNLAKEIAQTTHLEFRRDPTQVPASRVFANGRDVTDAIRTPEVSLFSSQVSAIPEVRSALLGLQRKLGCVGKTILEGRDIGTVIFPDADVKFFLTATLEERAKRRLVELEATGKNSPPFEELKRQIHERDLGDRTRAIAPLKKSEDAIELDTSHLTLDEVVLKMKEAAQSKLSELGKSKCV